jgi:hypothetical protein
MLFMVTTHKAKGGFFLRRKAQKGKLPPALSGVKIGNHMATKLELFGKNPNNSLHFLAPYQKRGDVLIASLSLEPHLQFNQPYIEEYARRQCVNFCIAALSLEPTTAKRQVILIDKDGACAGVAAELLAVCNTVFVATHRPERFAPCQEYTLQKYGTAPLFAKDSLPQADLIIAPYGTQGFPLPTKVLLAGPKGPLYPKQEDLFVPPYVAELVWEDMDPIAVTAGLFNAFYPKDLMEAVPNYIHLGGHPVPPEKLFGEMRFLS